VDRPLKSVTHGQCDARPTVTFPAAEHHCPLAPVGRYQIILLGDRGTWVCTTCPELLPGNAPAGSRTCNLSIASPMPYHYTTESPLLVRTKKATKELNIRSNTTTFTVHCEMQRKNEVLITITGVLIIKQECV